MDEFGSADAMLAGNIMALNMLIRRLVRASPDRDAIIDWCEGRIDAGMAAYWSDPRTDTVDNRQNFRTAGAFVAGLRDDDPV